MRIHRIFLVGERWRVCHVKDVIDPHLMTLGLLLLKLGNRDQHGGGFHVVFCKPCSAKKAQAYGTSVYIRCPQHVLSLRQQLFKIFDGTDGGEYRRCILMREGESATDAPITATPDEPLPAASPATCWPNARQHQASLNAHDESSVWTVFSIVEPDGILAEYRVRRQADPREVIIAHSIHVTEGPDRAAPCCACNARNLASEWLCYP